MALLIQKVADPWSRASAAHLVRIRNYSGLLKKNIVACGLLEHGCMPHGITLHSCLVFADYSHLTQYWTDFNHFCR